MYLFIYYFLPKLLDGRKWNVTFTLTDGQQYATGSGSRDSTVANNSERVEKLYKEAEI